MWRDHVAQPAPNILLRARSLTNHSSRSRGDARLLSADICTRKSLRWEWQDFELHDELAAQLLGLRIVLLTEESIQFGPHLLDVLRIDGKNGLNALLEAGARTPASGAVRSK